MEQTTEDSFHTQTRKTAIKAFEWASDVTTSAVTREAYEIEGLNVDSKGDENKHMQYDTFSEDLFSVLYEMRGRRTVEGSVR